MIPLWSENWEKLQRFSFHDETVRPHFTYCSWKGEEKCLSQHPAVNSSFIHDTESANFSLIITGGLDLWGYYTIVICLDTTKHHYIVMDTTKSLAR